MSDIDSKKISDKNLKSLTQAIKDMNIHDINLVEEKEQEEFIEVLNATIFDKEIEQILANFNEETIDLTKLETQIILLIKRHIDNVKKKNINLKKQLNLDEKVLAKNIEEITRYLVDYKIEVSDKNNDDLKSQDDNYKIRNTSKQSRQDLKKIIKSFAIYQIYKVMNPRRIAGETKRDNFIHNMLVGGMKRAKHYTGGKAQDLANYPPNFVKYLENKNKDFAKSKGRIL